MKFPSDFVWGAATAAYQIEGSVAVDGRGRSIWDAFSHSPGRVNGGDTGDVAVDHYRRFRDDVRIMADLGLTAYRFSVAWPRIQPSGAGAPNQAGLDFYSELVDELCQHGIEPWLTLYHWDLPLALENLGGWPERDTAARFADYASVVHTALGDRVRQWTTMNEPWCSAFLGYASGVHAPGRTEPGAALRAAHHLMLGHGLATQAIRAADSSASIGVTLNLYATAPATGSAADADAARRVDGMQNRLFLDPILLGSYPADVLADLADAGHDDLADVVHDGDLTVISTPIDLLGINYYSRHLVAAGPAPEPGEAPSPWVGSENVRMVASGLPTTAMGWDIDSAGLSEVLGRVHDNYPEVPLYVTENGSAFDDEVGTDGAIHDLERTDYLEQHLTACHQAIAAGVPLRGYFAWSLLDNFEWAWGYSKRFGLVYVDYSTQERIPKDSARRYAEVIRQGAILGQ
jgi:beta-glucosidase